MQIESTSPRSRSARSASPLLGIALALSGCATVYAQISPGRLSGTHREWDAPAKCASCHEFGAVTSGLRCLECHAEIRRRVTTGSGFHAKAYKTAAGETDCARCHKEHKGQAFALVSLDRTSFDHRAQTGFALEGKHRAQKCEKCHTAKNISVSSRPEIKLKDINRSFLGLRRECVSCHEDRHRAQLGVDCARCHTPAAWKPAPGFDHSRAAFVLTGLHQTTPCAKCHQPRPGSETIQFKGLAFGNCQSCHTDPHRGAFQEVKFRGTCEHCHNTKGWKNNRPGADFDHNTTKFALLGKHGEKACSKCHKASDFRRPIAHEHCRDCHEDPHKAQFASRAAGSDCSACHNEKGFKPSLFDRTAHRQSAFNPEGKHAALPCAKCHQPEGPGAVYVTRKLVCSACHADQHNAQFARGAEANRCDLCHTQDGFKPATFSVERHAKTNFALTGKHAKVECERCHKPLAAAIAAKPPVTTVADVVVKTSAPPRQYHFTSQTCNACHDDPHRTQVSCEECHTTETWKAVRPFDHSATKFGIGGAHQKVKCIDCHKPSGAGSGDAAAVAPGFYKTSNQCSGCHGAKDAHGGQFLSAGRVEDCAACHTTARWQLAGLEFDHDKVNFVLDRAHRSVACAKCHKDEREVNGKMVRLYRDTVKDCIKCHP